MIEACGKYNIGWLTLGSVERCVVSWDLHHSSGALLAIDPVKARQAKAEGRLLEYIETERAIRAITNGT